MKVAEADERLLSRPYLNLLLMGLLGLALVAGILARWQTLPDRPLAVDEYYMVRSTEFVLDRGVPEFPAGGYYTRGMPLQYLMAGSALLFGRSHLSYRLPTFVFSVISIVLAYWYARRFTSAPVSMAVALALLVSSWQIEFAGFARMYASFQCIVLLFLIAVDDAFFSGGWRRRYLPHGLAVLACLIHSIGITLAPLLFLPVVAGGPPGGFRSWSERLRFGAVSLAAALLCAGVIGNGLANTGIRDPLPPGYAGSVAGGLNLPLFWFWPEGDLVAPTILVAGLAALVFSVVWLVRQRPIGTRDLWLVALMAVSVVHLFALAAVVLLVLLLRYDLLATRRHPRRAHGMLAIAAAAGVAWLGYALSLGDMLQKTPTVAARWDLSQAGLWKALWTLYFSWPDLYLYMARPFLIEMPAMALLLLVALATVLIAHRQDPLPSLLRLPWVIVVLTILIYGVVNTEYSRLRYWYHLYPVMLCLIALAVTIVVDQVGRRWPAADAHAGHLAAFAFLGIFALTSDFDPRHIAQAGGDSATFRTGRFEKHAVTWYERYDYVTPAQFVNQHASGDPSQVIVEYQYPAAYYLDLPYAIYIPQEWEDLYPIHSRERGTRDAWSNHALLGTADALRAYTAAAREVWMIRGTDRTRPELPDPARVWGARLQDVSRTFLSRDQRIEVLHITLGPPETPPGEAGLPVPDASARWLGTLLAGYLS